MVVLCGVQNCCPTIELVSDGGAVIRDDDGGKVTLKPNEWSELKQRVLSKTL